MKTTFAILALLIVAIPSAHAEPARQCTTTLQVNDCGETPVVDRKIKIETASGERFKQRTDSQGQVVLEVCHDEITSVKVSGINNHKMSRATSINSTDTEMIAVITLNICDA